MAGNTGPQSDNPIFDIFNRVLGQGSGRQNASDRIDKLLKFADVKDSKGPSNFLSQQDPRNITRFGKDNYQILSGVEDLEFLRSRFSSTYTFDKFKEVFRKTPGDLFLYNPSEDALFRHRPLIGSNPLSKSSMVPIPIPSEYSPDVINLGYQRYAVSDFYYAGGYKRPEPVLDTLYNSNFNYLDPFEQIKRFKATPLQRGGRNMEIPYSPQNIKLRYLLNQIYDIRGEDQTATVIQRSLLQNFINSKDIDARPESFKSMKQASAASNIITRAGFFKRVKEDYPFLAEAKSAREAMDIISQISTKYNEDLLNIPGLEETYPYVKPEYLLGQKRFKVGGEKIKEMFPTGFYSARILEKGLYQMFNIGFMSKEHQDRLGPKGYTSYVMKGQAEYADRGMGQFLRRGRNLKVAVLDFEDALTSALWTQDSGAFLTQTGAANQARKLYSGTLSIPLGDPSDIKRIERVIGSPGSKFGYNKREVDEAFSLSRDIRKAESKLRKAKTEKEENLARTKLEKVRESISNLSQRNKNLVDYFGLPSTRKSYGTIRSAAAFGYEISSFETKSGKAIINLRTSQDVTPAADEMIIGSLRHTAVTPNKGTYKEYITKSLGAQGIDVVISSADFRKEYAASVLMDNMFAILNEKNLLGEAASEINRISPGALSVREIRTSSGEVMQLPVVNNFQDAVNASMKLLRDWSKRSERASIAKDIIQGQEIQLQQELPKGVRGIRMFNISGGYRSDFMQDISPGKGVRITPSKILSMARHNRALGISRKDNPYLDLVLKEVSSRSGLYLDSKSLSFRLKEGSQLRHAAELFAGGKPNVITKNILRYSDKDSSFYLGKRKLRSIHSAITEYYGADAVKNISSPHELFSFSRGGIHKDALKGTILDKSIMPEFAFLEMGNKLTPIPLKQAGLGTTLENHLVVPSQQRELLNRIVELETSFNQDRLFFNSRGKFEETAGPRIIKGFNESLVDTFKSLMKSSKGKKGALERGATFVDKFGVRARLIPQRGYYTADKILDVEDVFTMRVDRMELEDLLSRKMGQVSPKGLDEIRKNLKEKGYTYALAGVDPTQRGEHQSIVKLVYEEKSRMAQTPAGKQIGIGQLNVSANPVWFRMAERDTDRDVINLVLMDGHKSIQDEVSQKRLERLFQAQTESMRSFASWHQYELASEKFESLTAASSLKKFFEPLTKKFTKTEMGQHLTGYLAQKSQAHYGYTITRSGERFMDIVQFSDEKAISSLPISERGAMLLSEIRAVSDKTRAGVASNLSQILFQGGVSKGQRSTLHELATNLISFREKVSKSSKYIGREQMIRETMPIFREFLESQYSIDDAGKISGKRREFAAMDYILKDKGYTQEAINMVRKDLEAEAAGTLTRVGMERIKRASSILMEGTSRILAENVGVAYGLQPLIRAPENLISVIQDQSTHVKTDEDVLKRIVEPLLGERYGTALSNLTEEEIQKSFEKAAADAVENSTSNKLTKALSQLSENLGKRGALLGTVGGAIAGAAAYGYMDAPDPPSAPLPMPMNRSQPSDMGPIVPETARLYGNSSVAPMRDPFFTNSANSIAIDANPYSRTSSQGLIVQDRVAPINPGLVSLQMRNIANSDFNY